MVLALLLTLLSVLPAVKADAGDFHKWAVIVGTFLGSTVVLAILCFIIYYIFIKKWLDDYLSESTYRQNVVYQSQPTTYVVPHQEKMNMWNSNSNNRNGVVPHGEKRNSSDTTAYDQYYDSGYRTKTLSNGHSGNYQPKLSNSTAGLNYQQAYQQAVSQSYNSEPRMAVGSQISTHKNDFGLSSRSTLIAEDAYSRYGTPAERDRQSANAYRSQSLPQKIDVLSAAYTGLSV